MLERKKINFDSFLAFMHCVNLIHAFYIIYIPLFSKTLASHKSYIYVYKIPVS